MTGCYSHCTRYVSFATCINAVKKAFFPFGRSWYPNVAQVYGLSTVFSQMSTEPLSSSGRYDSNPIFYVAGSSMVYEKEVYIFDFLDLVANIGGYLGLFLGARCVKNSLLVLTNFGS